MIALIVFQVVGGELGVFKQVSESRVVVHNESYLWPL